jgi:hypothetical protein
MEGVESHLCGRLSDGLTGHNSDRLTWVNDGLHVLHVHQGLKGLLGNLALDVLLLVFNELVLVDIRVLFSKAVSTAKNIREEIASPYLL